MASRHRFERSDGTTIEVSVTDRRDGDFRMDADPTDLHRRRSEVMAGDWSVVRQVHGARVVDAAHAGPDVEADAIVTADPGRPIAVQGADCAPVALVTESGPIGVAHVGWRGLQGGVLEATIDRLGRQGAVASTAVVGPHIGPECYRFGEDDLARIADRVGDEVRASTADGEPALDLAAGIRVALRRAGVTDIRFVGGCTACGAMVGYSHRARQEEERIALVARIVESDRAQR